MARKEYDLLIDAWVKIGGLTVKCDLDCKTAKSRFQNALVAGSAAKRLIKRRKHCLYGMGVVRPSPSRYAAETSITGR